MSQRGQEELGTGLRDVFDILAKAPPERLQSLTIQLSESPEDNIIHALCLVVLRREEQALNKFQMLTGNRLANHLAERLQMGGCSLEDFGDHCCHFQELAGETLTVLARIFKVLSEQRLCEPLLRNVAYQRALSTAGKNSSSEDVEYTQLREEAQAACGPQDAEGMCSLEELRSGPFHNLHTSLDEGNTALNVALTQDPSQRASSLPSPLQASSSLPSYPTHLEISLPPTVSFQGDKRIPETSDESEPNTPILLGGDCEAKTASLRSLSCREPLSSLLETNKDSKMTVVERQTSDGLKAHREPPEQNTKLSTEIKIALPTAANVFQSKMTDPDEIHESKCAEDDEEAIFYAFVILHAPEDEDVALSMKERLEGVVGMEGAIFSDNFAIPGKSTLRCVEDAINNSAFTVLLLTRNFNTRMLELKTNSALISSINEKHKYNTVIPLLPRENCMPRHNMPVALQTIVPLEDNRNFERKVQRAISPAKLQRIKNIWTKDQKVKVQIKRQDKLQQINHIQNQLIKELSAAQLLERENLSLLMKQNLLLGAEGQATTQQLPNIHIEHAKYIMIGNDSQMTVDTGGGADKEDPVYKETE